MPEPPLHLLRFDLDAVRLAREGAAAHLPTTQDDLGFVVHAMLAGLFGEGAVQPFYVLDETARQVPVLAYSRRGDAELRDHAATYADPARHAACGWDGFAVKPMPDLPSGRLLGFELRACPVVRLSSAIEVAGKDGEPQRYEAGHEVDAWLHRRFMVRNPAEVDRETAYTAWLSDRLGTAADLKDTHLTGFRRLRLVRRDHSAVRKTAILERPEALLHGTLEIQDAATFRRLLTRGVGRHCAFGFGMLLLRPPRPC
jgi:CRISPR system Cascade subunit CasE